MIEYGRAQECNMITELRANLLFHIPTAPVACTHWLNHGYRLCRTMLFRHNHAVGKWIISAQSGTVQYRFREIGAYTIAVCIDVIVNKTSGGGYGHRDAGRHILRRSNHSQRLVARALQFGRKKSFDSIRFDSRYRIDFLIWFNSAIWEICRLYTDARSTFYCMHCVTVFVAVLHSIAFSWVHCGVFN